MTYKKPKIESFYKEMLENLEAECGSGCKCTCVCVCQCVCQCVKVVS